MGSADTSLISELSLPSTTPAPTPPPTPTSTLAPICSPFDADCRGTRCHEDASRTCFEKDAHWASCLESCTPGVSQPSDVPPWQTPWTCNVLSPSDGYPLDTPVFLQSHRNQQLRDTGDGMVLIESHRAQNLQDAEGSVGFSPNTQGWEKWTIVNAEDGKVAFQSWFGSYLQDDNGAVKMSSNLGTWEMWSIILPSELQHAQARQ